MSALPQHQAVEGSATDTLMCDASCVGRLVSNFLLASSLKVLSLPVYTSTPNRKFTVFLSLDLKKTTQSLFVLSLA